MVQPKFKLHMSSSFYAVYCLNLQTEIYLLFFSHKIHIHFFENTHEQGLLQLRLSHQKTTLPQIIDMRKGSGYENR